MGVVAAQQFSANESVSASSIKCDYKGFCFPYLKFRSLGRRTFDFWFLTRRQHVCLQLSFSNEARLVTSGTKHFDQNIFRFAVVAKSVSLQQMRSHFKNISNFWPLFFFSAEFQYLWYFIIYEILHSKIFIGSNTYMYACRYKIGNDPF